MEIDLFPFCGPEDTSWKTGGGSSYSTAHDLFKIVRAPYAGKLKNVRGLVVQSSSVAPDGRLEQVDEKELK